MSKLEIFSISSYIRQSGWKLTWKRFWKKIPKIYWSWEKLFINCHIKICIIISMSRIKTGLIFTVPVENWTMSLLSHEGEIKKYTVMKEINLERYILYNSNYMTFCKGKTMKTVKHLVIIRRYKEESINRWNAGFLEQCTILYDTIWCVYVCIYIYTS